MIRLEYNMGVRRWLSSKPSISFCNVVSLRRGQLVQLTLVTNGREETMSGTPHPRLTPLSLNEEVLIGAGSSSAEQRPGIPSFKCTPEKAFIPE
jgi:hypothetical protein